MVVLSPGAECEAEWFMSHGHQALQWGIALLHVYTVTEKAPEFQDKVGVLVVFTVAVSWGHPSPPSALGTDPLTAAPLSWLRAGPLPRPCVGPEAEWEAEAERESSRLQTQASELLPAARRAWHR